MSELSERMRVQRPDVPEVAVWADEVAALERALKYCYDDKEVMQNVIDVLEQQVERLEEALKGADSLLDAMAVADIKRWLKPAERPLYARVHTEVREVLASQEEAQSDYR